MGRGDPTQIYEDEQHEVVPPCTHHHTTHPLLIIHLLLQSVISNLLVYIYIVQSCILTL